MAMAAVRLAARRLSGQQPQAILRSAVVDEQGLLNRGGSPAHALRRFTSSEACAAKEQGLPVAKVSAQHPSVSGSARDERLITIGRKKEEMYDLLAEIQLDKGIPRTIRMNDRRLLQRLTDHVHPRPRNPEWHKYRREHAGNFLIGGVASFFVALYIFEKWDCLFDKNKQDRGADSSSKPAGVSCLESNIEEKFVMMIALFKSSSFFNNSENKISSLKRL